MVEIGTVVPFEEQRDRQGDPEQRTFCTDDFISPNFTLCTLVNGHEGDHEAWFGDAESIAQFDSTGDMSIRPKTLEFAESWPRGTGFEDQLSALFSLGTDEG